MALLNPVPGARLTQGFGPSLIGVEPAMYSDGRRAWWQPFEGARFYAHYHAAHDLAAVQGTPIIASEAGVVIDSRYDSTNGGGHVVRVEIRPGTSYCSNHMARRLVAVGARVTRGQQLGTVGSTGWSTGPHDHFWVGLDDEVGSQTWPRLYNPGLFFKGGALANDPRIQPVATRRYVNLNGPGINIRTSPDLDVGGSNIFATSRSDGIYRNGKRIAGLGYDFTYLKRVVTDDGPWFRVTGFGRTLYLAESVCHFT